MRRKKTEEKENIFKEIMPPSFPNFMKTVSLTNQGSSENSKHMKYEKKILRHIIVNFFKMKSNS